MLQLFLLKAPKPLLFFLCFGDADRSAAMAAHVYLLHYVKICRRPALRAVNICDPVLHIRVSLSYVRCLVKMLFYTVLL